MKSFIIAGLLLGASHGAAIAGFTGSEYGSTVIDNHVGYEGSNWYVQAGPAIVTGDGTDPEVELSGKLGASAPLSEDLSLYGEVSFITGDDSNSYGTKAGLKYNFWFTEKRLKK